MRFKITNHDLHTLEDYTGMILDPSVVLPRGKDFSICFNENVILDEQGFIWSWVSGLSEEDFKQATNYNESE